MKGPAFAAAWDRSCSASAVARLASASRWRIVSYFRGERCACTYLAIRGPKSIRLQSHSFATTPNTLRLLLFVRMLIASLQT